MKDYTVELYFEGYNKPETSSHFDCDSESEAISEAIEHLEPIWAEQICDIEVFEEG